MDNPDSPTSATNTHQLLQQAAQNARNNSIAMRWFTALHDRLHRFWLSTKKQLGLLTPPPLFNPTFYQQRNPDVATSRIDPYIHYRVWGWKEGRNPSTQFDVVWYLSNNLDVVRAGTEPLTHYMAHGEQEGRSPLSPAAFFQQFAGKPVPSDTRLCFCIPASPNDEFYSQVAMFRLALDALGGVYKQADIVLFLSDEEVVPFPDRWKPYMGKNFAVVWADPDLFRKYRYFAQVNERWLYDYDQYDVVCFVDADVTLLQQIDELILSMLEAPAALGVITHYNFLQYKYYDPDCPNPHAMWQHLARKVLNREIAFDYQHALADNLEPEWTHCPFYLNFGFVMFTPHMIQAMRDEFTNTQLSVAAELEVPHFSGQIALTLSLLRENIPTRALPMKYNFPNDRKADAMYPEALADVRIIHFLRTEQFDRQKIFTSPEAFDEFLSLELVGSDHVFQSHIRNLTGGEYPFGSP